MFGCMCLCLVSCGVFAVLVTCYMCRFVSSLRVVVLPWMSSCGLVLRDCILTCIMPCVVRVCRACQVRFKFGVGGELGFCFKFEVCRACQVCFKFDMLLYFFGYTLVTRVVIFGLMIVSLYSLVAPRFLLMI